MSQKCKLWSQESMEAAVQSVQEGKGLQEASRLYNVPVETLRRRITGKVELNCRLALLPYQPKRNREKLSITSADMGYGLTKEAVMYMVGAYHYVTEQTKQDGKAGCWWFQGFKGWHPSLTVCMPQPLSYARALNSTKEVKTEFWES